MRAVRAVVPALFIFALILAGCSKNDTPTAPAAPATAYTGVVGGSSEAGSLTLNFASAPKLSPDMTDGSAAIIVVTGTVKFVGGSSITLTGTYNTANDSLIVSGGGYTFMGTYDRGTGVV